MSQPTKSPLTWAFCRLIGGVWRLSLHVGINLKWTGQDLRISEVTRPDRCIAPEADPVLRGTSKLDTVNKFVNILKVAEGIARVMYCLMIERQILVLHVFVNKTQKTPPRELRIARQRMKEFKK